MAYDITAYDGGQEHRMRLGEVETLVWRLTDLPDEDALSSATVSIIAGTGVTAVQAYISPPEVGFRVTAESLGQSEIEVSLNTSLGDLYKHRLIIDVFE